MKRHALLTLVVLATLVQSAFAWGPPWASDTQTWGPQCTTCIATGTTPAGIGTGSVAAGQQQGTTPLYLGLGYGDGTQPMPRDGTGFGSPW